MSFLSQIPFYTLVGLTWLTMILVLVAAHELGHYLFARLFGMGAEEFSVGMFGKRPLLVYARRRYTIPVREGEDPHARGDEPNALEGGGATVAPAVETAPDGGTVLRETTLFTIRPWPVGGFVRIKGMMPQDDGGEVRIPGGFFSKSPWKRWVVLAAGPGFSVLAGILLLIPYFMFHGADELSKAPVFGMMTTDGAAYKAGLGVGDRVVSVDGVPTPTFYDIVSNVRDSKGRPLSLVVERDGARKTVVVSGTVDKDPSPVMGPDMDATAGRRIQTKLGALPSTEPKRLPFPEAVRAATIAPLNGAIGFALLLAHPSEIKDNVGGPGTMIKMTAKSVREGLWPVIGRAAQISISLGIFNLLPIPPLDGGQMWIAFVEMLRRGRRLSMRTQVRVLNVGFAMVAAMVAGILLLDAGRITGLASPPKITDERR